MSLTEAEKSLLVKGLSFSLPPKQLSYSDYLINFELFYRSIDNLKILSGGNLDFIKTRIKDTALTSFRNYNANVPQHLSNEEFEALKTLSGNCNLVIQKADKGNSVAIVEKDVFVRHTETILSDLNKFEKVSIKKGILNFSINHEKNINNYLKRLEKSGSLSTEQYKKIKAVGSRPGILYGRCKVHKANTEVCPPFRPILSATGTPSYKLAKFLVPKLVYRCFKICSDWTKFHEELSFLKQVFLKNGYPLSFIDNCFKTSVDKLFIKRPQLATVEKKTLFLS